MSQHLVFQEAVSCPFVVNFRYNRYSLLFPGHSTARARPLMVRAACANNEPEALIASAVVATITVVFLETLKRKLHPKPQHNNNNRHRDYQPKSSPGSLPELALGSGRGKRSGKTPNMCPIRPGAAMPTKPGVYWRDTQQWVEYSPAQSALIIDGAAHTLSKRISFPSREPLHLRVVDGLGPRPVTARVAAPAPALPLAPNPNSPCPPRRPPLALAANPPPAPRPRPPPSSFFEHPLPPPVPHYKRVVNAGPRC